MRAWIGTVVLLGLLAACSSSSHPSEPSRSLAQLSVTSSEWRGDLAPALGCASGGSGHSPSLSWSGAPPGITSYAVTITDPDANGFLHWAVLGIPPSTTSLPASGLPPGVHELANGFGKSGYGGPCPPAGARHHYVLTVWAVQGEAATLDDVRSRAVATGTITATYAR